MSVVQIAIDSTAQFFGDVWEYVWDWIGRHRKGIQNGSDVWLAVGGVLAGIGTTAKSLGLYTITHAVTGATMLGSTLGGASGAGTIGIMGKTSGFLLTKFMVFTNPWVLGLVTGSIIILLLVRLLTPVI